MIELPDRLASRRAERRACLFHRIEPEAGMPAVVVRPGGSSQHAGSAASGGAWGTSVGYCIFGQNGNDTFFGGGGVAA